MGGFAALERMCQKHSALAAIARRRGDVAAIVQSGKMAIVHAAEGGHHVERSLEKLEQLAERGLRYLTLTHFVHNGIAQPARLPRRPFFSLLRGAPGLTGFGRALVRRCEELGVLVDLTHCSDRSFADVLSIATKPLLVTHTGFRRFAPFERNLSDEQAKQVARTGGVIGVISWKELLGGDSVETMADAVAHGASVAGPEHVGIGTDFDGWVSSAQGMRDATCYPALTEALVRKGFSDHELRGILGGNYLRVLGESL
jgi:membrane dipeptidase